MNASSRQRVIIGNWKMYKTVEESVEYIKGLLPLMQDAPSRVYLAVPFTTIKPLSDLCINTQVFIGGQNMHDSEEGAFTGEIAGRMLKEAGAHFVILGHSERRRLFAEGNEFINKKVRRALTAGLKPVLCIGETAKEREQGQTESVLVTQLTLGLEGVTPEQATHISIAYEPVWAIGTSKVATPDIVVEAHGFCRQTLEKLFGAPTSEQISILYGGSVKPENSQALLEQPNVDGLLIGTSSLDFQTFSKILKSGSKV